MPRSEHVDTPHGRCIVLELDEVDAPLLGDELAIAAALAPVRRRELVAGRAALREALGMNVAILPDDRGAPVLPAGWVGSISHKGPRAAALVAPAGQGFIGVDLEVAAPSRMPIERRILTPREQGITGKQVTLRFAIKEAIYKAVDPFVRRYVAFTEVELEVHANGRVDVHVLDPSRLPVTVEAWWHERDGLWLATARANRL
jgi:4'-phosphopantetheinyl transferase EntD